MIRPTVSSETFPYRGPKNRLAINGLLTTAKRDFNFCSDFANHLINQLKNIFKFYINGETDEKIKEKLVSYDEETVDSNIEMMDKKTIILKNKINNLLFGG
jgi:hypothetical protein